MAKVKITLPDIDANTLSDKEMMRKILSYLYQLNEELRYQLTHIDDENITSEGLTEAAISPYLYKKISKGDLESLVYAEAGKVQILVERKLDKDSPAVGVDNSSVLIDPDGIDLATGERGQIKARVGEDIELLIDKNGVTGDKGVFNSVEAPNIVQAFAGGEYPWQGTLQATLDAMPRYLKEDTTITLPAGTYLEDVHIHGIKGAALTLKNQTGAKVTINGKIEIEHCDRVILEADALGNFEIYPTQTENMVIYAHSNTWVQLSRINVSGYRGSASTGFGVFVIGGGFQLNGTCIEYTTQAAILGSCSLGWVMDCKGGGTSNANSGYSIMAQAGAHIGATGTIPKAANGNHTYAGTIVPNGTLVQTEGGIDYVTPTSITQTFTPSKHVTYLLGWSRTRDDTSSAIVQGSYRGKNGNDRFNAGLVWFSGATSALAGKTILSATLKIRRASGGYSNAVPVWLCTSTLTEAAYNTTYDPPMTTPTTPGSLAREAEGTYDVTSMMSAIQSGGAIAVYENRNTRVTDTWSPAYTQFYGKNSNFEPVLTVTYR